MSFGRKTKAALAPICLIFSLFISFQAQSANRCLELFKVDLEARYGRLVDHYQARVDGLTTDQVAEQGVNLEVFHLVQLKLTESKTQYAHVVNEKNQLEAVQVLPMVEGSWQNKMALELWQKHGAKVFVDLLGRKIAAGVFSGFDIHAFKYDRILVLSLAEFMFDGLQSRSEVFRHELRHLGFIKKIREGALTEKIPLTTGMILAQSEVAGFRREIWGLQEDGYRDFLSLEELWTYTHDARFDVEILLRKIKQQKDLNDIYERNERIENAVRRLIVFFARAAQIGDSMRLQDFYTLTTFIDSRTQRPSVSMMSGGQGSEVDLLSKWAPLLYGHDIVHGIYKVKSNHQDEGFFWLSMPLTVREDKQSGNYLFLKRQMNQRIASLASISQKSREDLLPSYNQWLKATQEFLYKPHSPEDAKNLARVYIQSLQGLYDSLLRTKLLIN